MGFLFWKNFATFFFILILLLVTLLSHAIVNSPWCEIYSNGSIFYSCAMITNSSKEELSFIDVPVYAFCYIYMLGSSVFFLLAFYMSEDYHNPFALRYFNSTNGFIDYRYDDLVKEVIKLIRFNTDMKFVMRDTAIHLLDVLHMIAHGFTAYMFSFYCSLKMGYTPEEAAFKIFPSVLKCSFNHWPFEAECEVGFGSFLRGIFIGLWMWYGIMSIVIISNVIAKIRKCYHSRKNLKQIHFSKLEDWLMFVCQEKIAHLNRRSCCLRMRGFKESAKRLVLEPLVRMHCPEELEMDIELEALLPSNSEGMLVICNSWVSLDPTGEIKNQIVHDE